jgi:amino acid transporter
MLPASEWLSKINDRTKVPTNALIVASVIPIVLAVIIYIRPDSLVPITAFAVLGIYLAFQSVVLAALVQRFKGWKPAGPFNFGSFGIVINVAALAYGLWAIWWLLQPGVSGDAFWDYITHIGLLAVLIPGLAYLFIARPDRRSNAPHSDAIKVSEAMRAAGK